MYRFVLLILLCLIIAVPVSGQSIEQELRSILADFTTDDGPAIAVQITTPEGQWSASAGLADAERPATPADRFRIGSMSKTFVAVVTLLLVEEDVFDLDDLAAEWLPDDILNAIANADQVTIRQLLAMRTGIDDYLATDDFWSAITDDPTRRWTAEDALTFAYDLPPLFEPGEDYNYSNSNYLLLQVVLEDATGQPLHELMRELIIEPLSLEDTYTQVSENLPGGFVFGYEDFDGDGVAEEVSGLNDGAGLADGGLISNVADLTTFYQALFQEQRVLSEDSLAELLDFQTDDEGGGYSLGLNTWPTPYGEGWGHSGGVVGFLSIGVYLPESEIFIMVLSASSEADPQDIALAVAEALP